MRSQFMNVTNFWIQFSQKQYFYEFSDEFILFHHKFVRKSEPLDLISGIIGDKYFKGKHSSTVHRSI